MIKVLSNLSLMIKIPRTVPSGRGGFSQKSSCELATVGTALFPNSLSKSLRGKDMSSASLDPSMGKETPVRRKEAAWRAGVQCSTALETNWHMVSREGFGMPLVTSPWGWSSNAHNFVKVSEFKYKLWKWLMKMCKTCSCRRMISAIIQSVATLLNPCCMVALMRSSHSWT